MEIVKGVARGLQGGCRGLVGELQGVGEQPHRRLEHTFDFEEFLSFVTLQLPPYDFVFARIANSVFAPAWMEDFRLCIVCKMLRNCCDFVLTYILGFRSSKLSNRNLKLLKLS